MGGNRLGEYHLNEDGAPGPVLIPHLKAFGSEESLPRSSTWSTPQFYPERDNEGLVRGPAERWARQRFAGSTLVDGSQEPPHEARGTSMWSSTRRLAERPAGVSFGATGSDSPLPSTMICRGATPRELSTRNTASARRSESDSL